MIARIGRRSYTGIGERATGEYKARALLEVLHAVHHGVEHVQMADVSGCRMSATTFT